MHEHYSKLQCSMYYLYYCTEEILLKVTCLFCSGGELNTRQPPPVPPSPGNAWNLFTAGSLQLGISRFRLLSFILVDMEQIPDNE